MYIYMFLKGLISCLNCGHTVLAQYCPTIWQWSVRFVNRVHPGLYQSPRKASKPCLYPCVLIAQEKKTGFSFLWAITSLSNPHVCFSPTVWRQILDVLAYSVPTLPPRLCPEVSRPVGAQLGVTWVWRNPPPFDYYCWLSWSARDSRVWKIKNACYLFAFWAGLQRKTMPDGNRAVASLSGINLKRKRIFCLSLSWWVMDAPDSLANFVYVPAFLLKFHRN